MSKLELKHVSRNLWVYCGKQKKLFWENCFENVVSDLKKNGLCVHKTTFRKSAETKKNKNKKTMKMCTIFGGFWGHN